MAVQLTRKLFNIDEYERMIEGGVFEEEARLELIKGEIVEMAPIGLRHAACVARLTKLFERIVGEVAIVSVQNSIRLPNNSQPQPDVALLRWRDDFYEGRRPASQDAFLLVEVAESSLGADRNVKLPLYAEAGIQEAWIVNLAENTVEVYSDPVGGMFQNMRRASRGELLALPATLNGTVEVNDIIG